MEIENVAVQFGAAVRRLRKQHRLSQEELATRADLHRTYVSDIERGSRNVSLESIEKLAAALETSLPKLFTLVSGPDAAPTGTGAGARILLIEDDPRDAELALAACQRANLTNPIDLVRDGAAAVAHLFGPAAAQNARPALILLDLQIPQVSGLEVLRRIRSDDRTRNIPVVVLTVSQAARDASEARQLGASMFIVKPLEFSSLSRIAAQLNFRWTMTASE